MNPDSTKENNDAIVQLDGEITIQRAAEFKDLIWSHLQKNKIISFDASKITEIDTAGLQILCSAHRTAQTRGGDAHLLLPLSPYLMKAIKNAGFKRQRSCDLDTKHSCLWTIGE
jgi:anti-anti-sigma factor